MRYVDIGNLEPQTTYFFDITSSTETILFEPSTFTTLEESDAVGTPQTLTLSLPQSFTEGVVYATASDGQAVSNPVSVFTSNQNATINLNGLTTNTDGEELNEPIGYRIYALSDSGLRFREDISSDTDSLDLTNSVTTAIYNPEALFQVESSPVASDEPVVDDPAPADGNSDPQPDPEPTPEPDVPEVPVSDIVSELPDTSLNSFVQEIGPLILGISFVFLGLRMSKRREY